MSICSRLGTRLGTALGLMVLGVLTHPAAAQMAAPSSGKSRGEAEFVRWCAGCHGDKGEGDGFAAPFMLPRPRDFSLATYHIRTTATGEVPTDDDLRRVIRDGLPGTAMTPWKDVIGDADLDSIIAHLKTLSPFFAGPPPRVVTFSPEPAPSPDGLAEGKLVYEQLKCFECHGMTGRGNGTSVPTLVDDQKVPTRASDLSKNWEFRGGPTVRNIYTGFRTGLNGTPMPSFGADQAKGVSDERLWRLAQYVRSLSPADPPETTTVFHAALARGALPASPADQAWDQVKSYYVPLTAQVIVKPRWFAPAVSGVWVQALHDRRKIALRLRWHDPSSSPDTLFQPWLNNIVRTMAQSDPPLAPAQGPDRFVITLPAQTGPDSASRPHFLAGNPARAAATWRWTSAPDAIAEGTSRGLTRFAPLAARNLTHVARYDDGEWQLQFTRTLVPADTTAAPTFRVGHPIPVAFFAADGSNGETGTRGSMSGWYTVVLDTVATASRAR